MENMQLRSGTRIEHILNRSFYLFIGHIYVAFYLYR